MIKRFYIQHSLKKSHEQQNELLVVSKEEKLPNTRILFIHGHQIGSKPGAWEGVRLIQPLVLEEFVIYLPSLLGYGGTLGTPDYSGPNTVKRLYETYVDVVNNKPAHIIGASRGATSALLFANNYPHLCKSVTAISGVYDIQNHYHNHHDQMVRKNIELETSDLTKLDDRSPINHIDNLIMPIMLIHGEEDEQVSPSQAIDFKTKLDKNGIDSNLHLLFKKGHKIVSSSTLEDLVLPFIIEKNG